MPLFDAAAISALEGEVILPVFYLWLDIEDLEIRATTADVTQVIAGSADAELDGTYEALDPRVVEVGDVTFQDGGSDTLVCRLSGITAIDTDLLNAIGDTTRWQERIARLWVQLRDENGAPQGAIAELYTGFMMALEIVPAPDSQIIELKIENYRRLLSGASGRTYLDQAKYDAADTSATASIGVAAGAKAQGGAGGGGGGSPYGGGDGGGAFRDRTFQE